MEWVELGRKLTDRGGVQVTVRILASDTKLTVRVHPTMSHPEGVQEAIETAVATHRPYRGRI